MAEPRARVIDGKKFMWDGREYDSRQAADAASKEYETQKFETRVVDEEDVVHVYTRRVVTAVSVEGPPM